jgi:hypothetical protein
MRSSQIAINRSSCSYLEKRRYLLTGSISLLRNYINFLYSFEDYEREMGICSARSRNGQKAG